MSEHECKYELIERVDGAVGYGCKCGNFMGCRTDKVLSMINGYPALKRENDGLRQEIIKVTVFYSKQMHPRIKGALLEIAAMEFDALLTAEEQPNDPK